MTALLQSLDIENGATRNHPMELEDYWKEAHGRWCQLQQNDSSISSAWANSFNQQGYLEQADEYSVAEHDPWADEFVQVVTVCFLDTSI